MESRLSSHRDPDKQCDFGRDMPKYHTKSVGNGTPISSHSFDVELP